MENDSSKDFALCTIPDDWNVSLLGVLVETRNGLWQGRNTPLRKAKVIRNTNFNNDGTLNLEEVANLEVQVNQFERRQLIRGDIILERSGGGPSQPVGRVVYFDLDGLDFSFSNFTTRLRVVQESIIYSKFLLYYLLHFYNDGKTNALQSRTTGIRNLNFNDYMQIPIPIPPLPEQHNIVHVLSTVQKSIEATEHVIAAARELKRSMMKYLFTYGPVLVHQADQVVLKDTEIGQVPDGWAILRIGDFAETKSGGTPSRERPDYFQGEIPWVKSGELEDNVVRAVEEYITTEAISNSSAKLFPKGTLLVAMYGATAGKVGLLDIDATTNQAVCAIFPQRKAQSKFLFYSLIHRRRNLLEERYGGAQPNVSQQVIRAFSLPLPPIESQEKIYQILESIDRKISIELQQKFSLELLFKSLLYHLMTGKIRTSDLD